MRSRIPRIVRAVVVLVVGVLGVGSEAVDFQSEVRTILSDKCYKCHGPSVDGRKAGLRLDTQEGSRTVAKSGALPIVPGQPDKSEMIARIYATNPDEVMPPPKSKMSLSLEEKDLLKKWVQEGASYDAHWAFRPIEKPAIPSLPGELATMVETPIDAFVLEAMQLHGLTFEPLASPEKRLRRLTFDLTGLPPTLAELESMKLEGDLVNWERRIEELMSRESFGERMTSEWLDVARYSDTYGYQVDRDRRVWPWRDWVIQAFNSNLPYDQFIHWQIAGDLFENPTRDQLLATTFSRLHPQKVEGGSVPEEFRIEYVADRLHTFGTAFMGLTLECARCHDHKYDPISQKEYYELSSFFDNIDEAGLYSYFTTSVPTPTLVLTTPDQDRALETIEQKIATLEIKFRETLESEEFKTWMATLPTEPRLPEPIAHYDFETMDGGSIPNLVTEGKPATTGGGNRLVDNDTQGKALQLTGDDAVNLPVGNFTRNQPFSVAARIFIPEKFERSVIFHRSRAWTDAASRGYEFLIEEGFGQFSLIHYWPGNAISVKTLNPIPVGEWVHILTTYDGSSRADGLAIYVNGVKAGTATVQDSLYKNITGGGGDDIAIGERFRDRGFKNGKVDSFRVYHTQLTALEITTVTPTGVNLKLPLETNWPKCYAAPLRFARTFSGIDYKRSSNRYIIASGVFEVTQNKDLGDEGAYPVYRGKPVLTDRSAVVSDLSERIARTIDIFDNGSGPNPSGYCDELGAPHADDRVHQEHPCGHLGSPQVDSRAPWQAT
ncbi:MAG: DUF1549 domain-containing protein, partial [Verrucomicrobia bacterium]|nr:DUF1549 domain-containing protein [Verrucomicrobiota bacterium]